MVPPVVGLADNGDFGKVIGRFGLYAQVHRTYQYADTTYQLHPEKRWVSEFISLETPLAKTSIWLNSLVTKNGNFDIRAIGLVHSAVFLAALWFFASLLADAPRTVRWVMYALTVFAYCDKMYATSLNSFYMDEPAYLFILLTAVFYLRLLQRHRRRDAVLLMLCPFLAVAAKAQHAILGFWIAILFVVAGKALRPIRTVLWYAAALLLALESGAMIWKAQPADYSYYSLYNVTFEAILPHSRNVTQTLKDLGLDDSYRFCIGKKAYFPDSGMYDPAFRRRFFKQYSFAKLAAFYWKHPDAACNTMITALSEASDQRAFGNFDITAGYAPFTQAHSFAWSSGIKRRIFSGHGAVFLFAFIGLSALLCALLAVQRARLPLGAVAGGVCLIAAACTEMGLATLCDSMDIARHSMIFLALFDMIALACVYLFSALLSKNEKGMTG